MQPVPNAAGQDPEEGVENEKTTTFYSHLFRLFKENLITQKTG